jgi:hypothetical protein
MGSQEFNYLKFRWVLETFFNRALQYTFLTVRTVVIDND